MVETKEKVRNLNFIKIACFFVKENYPECFFSLKSPKKKNIRPFCKSFSAIFAVNGEYLLHSLRNNQASLIFFRSFIVYLPSTKEKQN